MSLSARVGILLLVTSLILPVAGAESFKSARLIPTATAVAFIQTADLNGDGHADIVYLSSNLSSGPHLLLGKGDGTFGADTVLAVPSGNQYRTLAIADVNKDGRLDIVLIGTNAFTSSVVVLLGNGDGTFQPGIVSVGPTGGSVFNSQIGMADFNGDGSLDLAIGDRQNDLLSTLLGDGAGHFVLKSTWFEGTGPTDIHVGDLNRDGKMDFVVHGGNGAAAVVYIGNGDGTFQTGVSYSGPNHVSSLFLKDMNNDGVLDLVVSTFSDAVAILLGKGDGTFSNTSAGGQSLGSLGGGVIDVEDLNGDGILDIVAATNDGICIATGKGGLAYTAFSEYPAGPFPGTAVAYADINGDGKTDFIVAVGQGPVAPAEGIGLLFGNGDGTLQSADTYDVGHQVTSIAIGDLNGDGLADLAVGVFDATPRILLGRSDGTFTVTPDTSEPTTTLNSPNNAVVGDFNGDGKLDLLTSHYQAYLQLGNGDGTFGSANVITAAGSNLEYAFAADFNKDGLTDLAFGNTSGIAEFLITKPGLTFQSSSGSGTGGKIVFGDVNHDGKIDAIEGEWGTSAFAVMLGNGDGTFAPAHTYPTAYAQSADIAIGDLDGDGNLDIVLPTMPGVNSVQLVFGNGDGTFAPPVSYPTPHPVLTVGIGDLNQDGKPDLILSDTNVLTVMHGIGDRSFDSGTDYLAGDGPSYPIVADVNGDGAPDLLFANYDNNVVDTATVLLNRGGTRGSITTAPPQPIVGSSFILSATYSASIPGSGTPTGNAEISIDGGAAQGAALSNGSASITANQNLALGTHTVSVTYGGDSNFNHHNISGQFTVVDYAVSLNPAAATVVAGQSSSVGVTVSSTSGFTGAVDLSCTGLPAAASCSFASSSISLQNLPSVSTTLTLNASSSGLAPIVAGSSDNLNYQFWVALPLITAMLVIVTFRENRLCPRQVFVSALLLLSITMVLVGCGGGSAAKAPTITSYTVQVQATLHGSNPSIMRTAGLSLSIQNN
jgi:hypothetical protein